MLYIGLITFLSSFILLILTNRYFRKKNIIDKIIHRSSHATIATRTGGLSLFTLFFIITLFFYIKSDQIFDFSILIPIGILFTIGLYDDIYQVDFKLKFIFQIIAAKIIVDQGFVIQSLNGFIGVYEIPYIIGQLFTIFLIIMIINAHNFSDGIDGLALTETIKSFVILLFLNISDIESGINFILFIVICSIVPLYYFNLKPNNKIFLGDSGSLFLGGIISIGIINLIDTAYVIDYNISTPVLIIICYLYPLVDLSRVVILRIAKGASPFEADRLHIHHKLVDKGFSHIQSVLIISSSFGAIQALILFLTISITGSNN
jgi:UDP-GlcNAc:undecaprenyl-phosphate/decaprenyl-phosphate GlcNAc-1-phosphate transferase